MTEITGKPLSRRSFVRTCAFGAVTFAAGTAGAQTGRAGRVVSLDRDWLFGGKFQPAAMEAAFDDSRFMRVTLPHCVAKLSWQNWDPGAWEDVWAYRRHFRLPEEMRGLRVFLHFDGVMVGATPAINGYALPQHLGGYLPFEYEITQWVKPQNVLAVAVDSRWSNVPPQGAPDGAKRVDYLEAGGIHRSVRLEAVPQVFIRDVFARPMQVLDASRRIELTCTIDAAEASAGALELSAELRQGVRILSRARQPVRLEKPGLTEVALTLARLGNVALWDLDSPNLYALTVTLSSAGKPLHEYRVRTGLREARFERDGFFLNGRRVQIFGLNRHEIFPYTGYAMPAAVVSRDAEIMRRELNCNFVRCSHYPQSPAFLDRCDELGLLVWEEVPGWQFLGDAVWKDLLVRDVRDMVVRDRNRPSVVIWGTRVNESASDAELYRRTRDAAKALDPTRPTSGALTSRAREKWQQQWHEDVFAYNDYHAVEGGKVGIREPVPAPYLITEAVGQFNYSQGKAFDAKYRRAGEVELQQQQALRHAQAHDRAAADPHIAGLVAWCAFDYLSLVNSYNTVKCPGVFDVFRIPKLGAAFYMAQADPKRRVVIQPNFYWDFGPKTPRGPGKHVAIFSNCDRLELFVAGRRHATLEPDRAGFPHLKHPPFFADLELDGSGHPDLRIDGYLDSRVALSRSFSSDPAQDQFYVEADEKQVPTRVVFKVVDKYGAERAFGGGEVKFEVGGGGLLVGDNPFSLAESGGVGAVWITGAGRITVKARHSELGEKTVVFGVR